MADVIEVEVASEKGSPLFFPPLGKKLRGRLDFPRVAYADPGARGMAEQFKHAIPGQVIGYDPATGQGYVREPLHEAQHAETRGRIARRWNLAPERTNFKGDPATFVYWINRSIAAGHAVLISGVVPQNFPGQPQKRFFSAEQPHEQKDRLLNTLVAAFVASLPAAQRKAFEENLSNLTGGEL
jgi:hypothetical protein